MLWYTAQTPPCLAERQSRAILLSRKALAREFKNLCYATIALVADFVIILRIKKFLIIASFTFIPNQGSKNLPKGVNPESEQPPSRFLTQQCKFRGVDQGDVLFCLGKIIGTVKFSPSLKLKSLSPSLSNGLGDTYEGFFPGQW